MDHPEHKRDCLSPIFLILSWSWVNAVLGGRIMTEYLISGTGQPESLWLKAVFPLAQGTALLLVLIPLATLWRNLRYRVIFQSWSLVTLFSFLATPVHLLRVNTGQLQAVLHILLGLIFVLLIRYLDYRRHPDPTALRKFTFFKIQAPDKVTMSLALAAAAVLAYPWLAWGALGSLLDTVLALVSALVLGLGGALILERFLFQTIQSTSDGSLKNYLLGGFSAGVSLMILAGGTGFPYGGMQLLLILELPALGWTLAWLGLFRDLGNRHNTGETRASDLSSPHGDASPRFSLEFIPLILLIGLAFAAPLALIDPDELFLLINANPGERLVWSLRAALVAWLAGMVLGVIGLAYFWRLRGRRPPSSVEFPASTAPLPVINLRLAFSPLLLIVSWIVGGWIYLSAGQPGFYGDSFFVIQKDQADLASASQIKDYSDRKRFVYQTLVQHAITSQAGLRDVLDRFSISYQPYYLLNGLDVHAGYLVRLWISLRPDVDRVLANPWLRPLPEPLSKIKGSEAAPSTPPWNLVTIGADRVWQEFGVNGKGIVVGQSDSGVQGDHPELAAAYRGASKTGSATQDNYNWYDPWYGSDHPVDYYGHGTHTLGSVLGQHTGVAPGASWIACVNLARNLGNPAFYLDCLQFMLAPFPQNGDPFTEGDPTRGAQVLNNSWGCPEVEGCDVNTFLPVMRALRAAGIFVVAGAGNEGPKCASLEIPPPIYQDVLAVGAIDRAGNLASFSSIGPVTVDGSGRIKPDLVAPGEQVLSSLPETTYGSLSGTSMSGPHVVGVVALMWSANPSLIGDVDRTEDILLQSARPYSGNLPNCPGANSTPSNAVGYGVLDAYAAVKLSLQEK